MGKTIGSGDLKLAKLYSKKLQKLFVFMGIICGVLLFFIRIPVLSLYQLSPETREMANTFLIILSVVMLGMSYQMPTNGALFGEVAVLPGGSDQYLGDCDPVIHVHGICGQSITGHRGVLP